MGSVFQQLLDAHGSGQCMPLDDFLLSDDHIFIEEENRAGQVADPAGKPFVEKGPTLDLKRVQSVHQRRNTTGDLRDPGVSVVLTSFAINRASSLGSP